FIDAVVETDADILLISSLNGEAEGWCSDLQFLRAEYQLRDVVFVIGGNLAVGEAKDSDIVPKYKSYGFDLVFHQVDLNTGLDALEQYMKDRS
ncbi:MAG: methylaspartate mutase subunit S, partial [Sulfurospirillaceae bacterium]|nr:methylaspartate mutase subunit S [Sulfurospirillaceae bacterium]